jgi:hypothetical protein
MEDLRSLVSQIELYNEFIGLTLAMILSIFFYNMNIFLLLDQLP